MVKLIASDLDGTIIGKDNHICKNNFNAINDINKKAIPLTICSGKTYPIIKHLCSEFNANYGIFGNGNQIINLKTGEEIYKKLLNKEDIKHCYSIAKKYKAHVHIYTNNEIITEKLMYMDLRNYKLKESNFYISNLDFKVVKNILEHINKNDVQIYKLVISSTNPNISSIENDIRSSTNLTVRKISKHGEYKDTIINKEYTYLDITPNNIGKNQALQFLSSYLNIEKNEILAIGDNLNDLEMVKEAGIGVAVANAYEQIKEAAAYTTTKSASDGAFAEAVYKFIEF